MTRYVIEFETEEREDNSYWYWDSCYTRMSDPDGAGPQGPQCIGGMRYVPNIDDEDWVLQVQTFGENGAGDKVRRKEVSREVYYRCEKGDWYDQEAKGQECRSQ